MRGIQKEILKFSLPVTRKAPFVISFHPQKQKPVNFLQYTFLESPLKFIVQQFSKHHKDQAIQAFVKSVKKNYNKIQQMQKSELEVNDLQECHKNMRDVVENYMSLKYHLDYKINSIIDDVFSGSHENIYENQDHISNGQEPKISKLTIICYQACLFNILDIPLWNKILIATCHQFQHMNLYSQEILLHCIKEHLLRYYYGARNQGFKNKFILRQIFIRDLIDSSYLIDILSLGNIFPQNQKTQNQIRKPLTQKQLQKQQSENIQNGLLVFSSKMRLISKFSKSININYNQLKARFMLKIPQLITNIDRMSVRYLLMTYRFFNVISVHDQSLKKQVEQALFQRLYIKEQVIPQYNIQTRDKFQYAVVLVTIWKNHVDYHQKLYQLFIKPVLSRQFNDMSFRENKFLIARWETILYDLLCSNIKDSSLPKMILETLMQNCTKPSKTLHICHHYLRIKQEKDHKKLLKDQKLMNQCQQYQRQSIQFNQVQAFWYKVILQMFPKENVFKSLYVCVFEVDMAVFYKGQIYAFQVQGVHYQPPQKGQLVGKKKIRTQILKSMGVKFVNIHCGDRKAKFAMRFDETKKAALYLMQKIEQLNQQQCQN